MKSPCTFYICHYSFSSDKAAPPPRFITVVHLYLSKSRQFYLIPVFSFPPQPESSLLQPSLSTASSVRYYDASPHPYSACARDVRPSFLLGPALQKLRRWEKEYLLRTMFEGHTLSTNKMERLEEAAARMLLRTGSTYETPQ